MKNKILEILEKIDTITYKKRNINSTPNKPAFKTILYAGFFRVLDYSLGIYRKKNPPDESIFLISGLRAICEDLIYIVAINKWPVEDANMYVKSTMIYELGKSIKAQHQFFKREKPSLLYLKPSDFSQRFRINNNDLVHFWKKNGYSNCEVKLPSVFQIAKKNGLESLYNFLYHATSKSVHHSVHYLSRMGWGNESCEENEFHYRVGNFNKYYFEFCRFYGIYLLCLYYKDLGSKIGIKKLLSNKMSLLLKIQKEELRWPEIVTFEEINVKPPSYFMRAMLSCRGQKNNK